MCLLTRLCRVLCQSDLAVLHVFTNQTWQCVLMTRLGSAFYWQVLAVCFNDGSWQCDFLTRLVGVLTDQTWQCLLTRLGSVYCWPNLRWVVSYIAFGSECYWPDFVGPVCFKWQDLAGFVFSTICALLYRPGRAFYWSDLVVCFTDQTRSQCVLLIKFGSVVYWSDVVNNMFYWLTHLCPLSHFWDALFFLFLW